MSTSLWILVVVGVVLLLAVLGWLVQWNERRKLGDVQRFVEERNSNGLTKYLRYWGLNKVQIRAAEALGELRDPATIPALLEVWETSMPEVQNECANALARMPGQHVVPLLLEKVEGEKKALVVELLRRFDLPEARAVVGRVDEERAEQREMLRRLLAGPGPSLADSLAASIAKIHRETQDKFAALLRQETPGISDPLSLKDSGAPASNISWNNSVELREASKCASDPATREDGIAKLKALSETHQTSSAPYALLAQAMEQNHQREEAEPLLLGAINKVHTKSEILDMLGNVSKNGRDYRKATAYYLMAAYAMNPNSTDWGTLVYLSGFYRAIGNVRNEERARECDAAAAAMRGGNRVDLTTETYAAIRETLRQHSALEELADSAWSSICDNIGRLSGKYEKETWTSGSPPAPASAVSEPIRVEAAAMLGDFKGSLDSLLRTAAPALNVDTASMDEKIKAAALLAQSDSQFRNQFAAVLGAVQNRAASISSALEEEKESEQGSVHPPGDQPALDTLNANSDERPFERRKLEVSWVEFAAKKATQTMAPLPEICLRCESTAMAESMLKLRPSSTSRFLRGQPFLIEFTDGTAAVFELESGKDTGAFVDELLSGNYGDPKPMVINGIVVGASDKKATIDILGVPQALSFGDLTTW